MRLPSLPLNGACRCGQCRITVNAPPLITAACHCTGCQRMTASAFSLTVTVPSDGFAVVAGEVVKGGLQSPGQDHYFCPNCKSWMFTRIAGFEDFVNLRATMLDDLSWFQPFIETMTKEKLLWVKPLARHSYEGFPPMEDFQGLIAEYGAAS
ncbi:MAG: GFA family protein [Albidovulum sp.]